jgi:hypothetical protein
MEITRRKRFRNEARECWAQDVERLGKAMIMDVDEARHIRRSGELNVGDEIEAWHNGKLFHRGTVTQTVTAVDLFWILDSRTGTRRLIDAGALVILRPEGPGAVKPAFPASGKTPPAPGQTPPAPGQTPLPPPHMPLFQAPGLAG